MKKYPSIWITKISENNWNISVKLRADMKATNYTKGSKAEAIKFCEENYGGYSSIKELI